MTIRLWTVATAVALVVSAAIARGGEVDPAHYRQEIEEWQKKRDARLVSPDYYLAVTGLFWLEPGENTFGADASNDFVFPGEGPARIGRFIFKDGTVRVIVEDGVDVRHGGEPVRELVMKTDHDEDTTELTLGTKTWYVIKRGDRYGIRLKDSASPHLKAFRGMERFPIDPSWRIVARFEAYEPPKAVPITNEVGVTEDVSSPGAVAFDVDGKTYKFDVFGEKGDETYWTIFADGTSGIESYGAGRFLYFDAPEKSGPVVIDFNKAYNPPCVFSNFTTCPLPPQQNILSVRVTAGEKDYKKDDKKGES